VPLARFDRYTWTTAETYLADIQLAHYGLSDLSSATVAWTITGADGSILASQTFPKADIRQGGLRSLGRVEASLAKAKAPARYTLEVTVSDGARHCANSWPLWVYPAKTDTTAPKNVTIVRAFDAAAKKRLAAGERVVLIPEGKTWGNTVSGAYPTEYWCWPMFHNTPGTMGLLCDPKHPALAQFPTAFHTERQWTAIVQASTPVILARTPAALRPIVQVIDNLERNEKLGLIFEVKVGTGSLLVCGVDLVSLQERPEARQLLASLLSYAASPQFAPRQVLDEATLDTLLRHSLAQGKPLTASSSYQPPWGAVPSPDKALDGDINTAWIARDDDKAPVLTVDLGKSCSVDAVELLWEYDEPGYRYLIESSADGKTWSLLSDQRSNTFAEGRHLITAKSAALRFMRLTMNAHPAGKRFSLRDWRVMGE
jgi:F5/8 type C domain